jgi:murein L,D-transpeptidase YcbB/YkuD
MAVARFQAAHGLAVDGAAGQQTLVSLNVTPAARLRQIRWNLERWRSLPRIGAATRIEVNAAAATAVLYVDHQPVKTMRAIVGAIAHPTPVLRARLSSLLLNPPWNVPSSIIENEIRPMLKTNPRYLERAGLVYVELNGARQLIQPPGPKNALGQIKFEMPNSDDIYLHDTPERQLFTSARRALSHGCVRVEDPGQLALLVLDSSSWSREALGRAIATGQTQSLALRHAVPVYLLYWTAFVDPDGTVEFRDDLYGRDRRLGDAVAAEDAAEHPAATGHHAKKG